MNISLQRSSEPNVFLRTNEFIFCDWVINWFTFCGWEGSQTGGLSRLHKSDLIVWNFSPFNVKTHKLCYLKQTEASLVLTFMSLGKIRLWMVLMPYCSSFILLINFFFLLELISWPLLKPRTHRYILCSVPNGWCFSNFKDHFSILDTQRPNTDDLDMIENKTKPPLLS